MKNQHVFPISTAKIWKLKTNINYLPPMRKRIKNKKGERKKCKRKRKKSWPGTQAASESKGSELVTYVKLIETLKHKVAYHVALTWKKTSRRSIRQLSDNLTRKKAAPQTHEHKSRDKTWLNYFREIPISKTKHHQSTIQYIHGTTKPINHLHDLT